jgi:hypothetical protein
MLLLFHILFLWKTRNTQCRRNNVNDKSRLIFLEALIVINDRPCSETNTKLMFAIAVRRDKCDLIFQHLQWMLTTQLMLLFPDNAKFVKAYNYGSFNSGS